MRIAIDTRLKSESGVGRYIRNLLKNLHLLNKKNKYIELCPPVRWHTVREQLFMPFYLLRAKPDLVHYPYFTIPLLYTGRFVVTVHDLTITKHLTGRVSTLPKFLYKLKFYAYRFVLWNAVHRSSAVIVPTRAVKRDVLDKFAVSPDKINVIYEGVDENLLMKDIKLISQKVNSKNYFLYVGNAYPHKNLRRLICAFRKLSTKKQSSADSEKVRPKLVLVGKRDYFYRRLEEETENTKIGKSIIFTGQVKDAELAYLYKNAIALVYPSLSEGFGLPAIEAMALSCPVLCSDILPLREICAGTATYFDPKDTESIFSTMLEIMTDQTPFIEKVKLGKNRAKKFRWQKTAEQTINLYEKVLQN